jgi:phosphoribosyl 1,2-cyclic phosphodiesterase
MTLRLTFWGTRGSVPTPGPLTVRYGGNTPCVEVRTAAGRLIILDAGTGLRELGRSLIERANGAPLEGDVFLTHAHWDHIQGLPFFPPIFQPGNRFTIWGPHTSNGDIGRVIREQMSPLVFPVPFERLGARVDFRNLGEGRPAAADYDFATFEVQHPGGAVAYRFTSRGPASRSFVYVSDNELAENDMYHSAKNWRDELVAFIRGAHVLVHDTTYTNDEYAEHRGWGHSTYDEALDLAIDSGVETLVLFHHKPERSDDDLDACAAACRDAARARGSRLRIVAAAEGMSLDV